MEQLAQQVSDLVKVVTPEIMVVIFTIIGALATSVIEIRKRKGLKALLTPQASDAAFELAKRAMESVERSVEDCNRKFEELSKKYDLLESKYFMQIEVNTRQAEQISKLNMELLYFRTRIEAEYSDDLADPEDGDPDY